MVAQRALDRCSIQKVTHDSMSSQAQIADLSPWPAQPGASRSYHAGRFAHLHVTDNGLVAQLRDPEAKTNGML